MKDIDDAFIEYKKINPFVLKREITDFNEKFPINKLKELKVTDYSLGFGSDTLCNWLEYETKNCGDIRGNWADKYYIYSNEELKSLNKFKIKKGRKIAIISLEDAEVEFLEIKKRLIKLYELGSQDRFDLVDEIDLLWPIVKTKFLYMNFSNKLLSIMGSNHLKKICDYLDFRFDKNKPILTNYNLLKELRKNYIFKNEHSDYISGFFYEYFDLKDKNAISANKKINFDKNREYKEGKIKEFNYHISKERNGKLIRDAKNKFKQEHHGELFCECCDFNFNKVYGYEYIEGHHINSIANLTKETKMKIKDITMLCSNCHSIVHYYDKNKNLSIKELKEIMLKKDLINNPQVS